MNSYNISMFPVGGMIGAMVGGLLGDKWGRRMGLLISQVNGFYLAQMDIACILN